MRKYLSLLFLLILSGCQVPQWRIFQEKVPEKIEKPAQQIEAERAAAKLVAETITAPEEMVAVADALSESLGEPDKPIDPKDLDKARDKALSALLKGMQRQQQQLDALNKKLEEYGGKKIEGTGFNMFGPSSALVIAGIVALCIFCPGVISVLFFALRRAKGALTTTIEGVQNFKAEVQEKYPEVVNALATSLDGAQDDEHKNLVLDIKAKLKKLKKI